MLKTIKNHFPQLMSANKIMPLNYSYLLGGDSSYSLVCVAQGHF